MIKEDELKRGFLFSSSAVLKVEEKNNNVHTHTRACDSFNDGVFRLMDESVVTEY